MLLTILLSFEQNIQSTLKAKYAGKQISQKITNFNKPSWYQN